eukprot:CAMPEP_0201550020 /NCGR_PEP_ID=MMETSP0173_2-20130828/6446_1 /ASSEMBLY_ACC=CAM_ASM_000268 /TAXON_ID=218659 /ORGANISM="Vexillifera sp., Strain DIVA3 564/2" /LENGTH=312 /DNA_ID=CAMNT_0047959893 /DNA_START=168 /DNA_END=1106 /DNA_ORIENTATION=-
MAKIHDEVASKFYGCGLIAPTLLKGMDILDLGSGSGMDCYVLSALATQEGSVCGIDMTKEQLQVAEKHRDFHAKIFGHSKSNVRFVHGLIEDLAAAGLDKDAMFDVIVSNCVINLADDKRAVLSEAFRVLKEGGEMYFSDVYADRRIDQQLVSDPILYGECLSGALYWNDFLQMARSVGFADPRLVRSRPLEITNEKVAAKIGHIKFYSATYRLFKLKELEQDCEDYGQAVRYRGTIEHHPNQYDLDAHHCFEQGKMTSVCANTFNILKKSRYAEHFEFFGDQSTHYGIFPGCGKQIPFVTESPIGGGGSCC